MDTRLVAYVKLMFVLLFSLKVHWAFAAVESLDSIPKHIFIAGDSTAASYSSVEQQGWGAVFADYFSGGVAVRNYARGGRSSRTFITEGLWANLIDEVEPGDLVLIQFGHNDAGFINDTLRARGSLPGVEEFVDTTSNSAANMTRVSIDNLQTSQPETVYTYGHYLRTMVKAVKERQGRPILMSLTARNVWHGDRIERGSGDYGAWAYQIAIELDVPFIDVTNLVADKLEAIGMAKTAAMYPKDHTHFNEQGAHLHASTIVSAIKGLRHTLSPALFSDIGRSVPTEPFTWLRLPMVQNRDLKSVFLVGDSTVRNGGGFGENGEWGWGSLLASYLNDIKVNVVNRAIGGMSSRTFITRGYWQKALNMMQPGDIVVMQFGHNDASPVNDETRARGTLNGTGEEYTVIENSLTGETETVHTYGWYLRKMIGEAKARGVVPIVLSPVPKNYWKDEHLVRPIGSYPLWAKQTARLSNSLFIDLHSYLATHYDELGQQNVEALFADEHIHTNKFGAELSAQILGQELVLVLGK